MFYSTASVCAAIFAYQRLQPRLNLKEPEPFIPYKALLIVLGSVSRATAMSCTVAVNLHHALNGTIFDATVTPLLMPDYPTRMSISATMWLSLSCSQPICYLHDRDEIADDVIIAKPRNRCVKVTTVSVIPSRCNQT